MQRFLFRKVELWLVLFLALLAIIGSIGFGAVVLDTERDQKNFGPIGRAALAVANVPETVRQMLKRKTAMAAVKWDRFKDQPGGWTFAPGAPTLPGYLLLSRYDGTARRHIDELVSMADGKVLYTWRPDADALLADAPRTSLVADFTGWDNEHYRTIHPFLLADGSLIIKDHQNYAMRIDACSKRLWLQDKLLAHHSTESDGEGGVWMPGLIEPPTFTDVQPDWREDAFLHLDADGNILSMESLPQLFMEKGRDWALFNASHRERDPVHLNDIQPVLQDGPFWKKGDLFLSMRHTSEIMLYRPSTREIVWSKQGPWLAQHDVDILDDHRIAIFDNHAYDRGLGARVDGANRVTIYDFTTGQTTGPWDKALAELGVETLSEGLFSILPDGTLMVEEENSGRLLFLAPDGAVRATYINNAEDGKTYRLGWSRWIDPALGDQALKSLAGVSCGG